MPLSATLRATYLHAVLARYGTVTLPIADAETHLALGSVFLPLHLRRDPLVAEDRERTQRRALLGETQTTTPDKSARTEANDAVIAASGPHALALTSTRRLVILGGPGTGKTTVLKDLLCTAARAALHDPAAPLPIFVLLPDLARSGLTMADYLLGVARTLGMTNAVGAALWEALSSGNAFLCLDSLDEVAPALRPDSIRLIAREVPRWGGACIVGSRFTEYRGGQFGHESFAEWEVTSLTHESRLVLAERLLPALRAAMATIADTDTTLADAATNTADADITPADADAAHTATILANIALDDTNATNVAPTNTAPVTTDTEVASVNIANSDAAPKTFVAAVEAHPQAAAWGENPLLFSLAAVIFTRLGELPIGRAALYHEVLSAVLETRLPDADRRTVLEGALAELALRLYMVKGRTFTRAEIVAHLPAIRAALSIMWTDVALATAILDCGALEVVAHETYGFRHLTFQEYLAADALARRLVSADAAVVAATQDFLWSKRTYSRWTEVLRLLVGILLREHGDAGTHMARWWLDALAAQGTTPEGDPGGLGLALAVKSLVEATASESNQKHFITLATRVVTAWAERVAAPLLDDRNQYTMEWNLGDEVRHLPLAAVHAGCAPLIAIMQSGGDIERDQVLNAFEKLGDHAPFAALIAALHKPFSNYVRIAAARVLGSYGAPAIPALWNLLNDNDEEWDVRLTVGQSLAKLQAPGVEEYVRVLAKGESDEERIVAVQMIEEMSSDVPFDVLEQMLHDDDSQVRSYAINAYRAHSKSITDLAPLIALLTATDERDFGVLRVFDSMAERAPIAAIIGCWEATHNVFVLHTLEGLAQWVPATPLIDLLPTVDGEERKDLGKLLLRHLTAQIPEALIVALFDDTREKYALVADAAFAIGKRASDIAPALLQSACSHVSADVRMNVINGCKECATLPEYIIPQIIALMYDSDTEVQSGAADLLGTLRVHVAKPALIAMLTTPSSEVRFACLEALFLLGEPGDQLTETQIHYALTDPFLIRVQAIELLGTDPETLPVDLLLPFLNDPDSDVREAAIIALSALQANTPIVAILPLLHDPSLDVRHAVILALKASGQEIPWHDIIPLLQNPALGTTKDSSYDYYEQQLQLAIIDLIGVHPEFDGDALLVTCLLDPDGNTAPAVVRALTKRQTLISTEDLWALFRHEHMFQGTFDLLVLADEDVAIAILLEELAKIAPDPYNSPMYFYRDLGRALRGYGLHVPLEPLLKAAASSHASTRLSAVLALGGQEANATHDIVVQALADSSTAAAAIETLAWQSDLTPLRDSVGSLLAMAEYNVTNALHDAFGKFPDAAPVEAMTVCLAYSNSAIRKATLKVLAGLGERFPIDAIAACLGDAEGSIRMRAAQALRTVGPRAPLAALTAALDDPYFGVRWEVARAIVAAGGEASIATYIEGLQNPEEEDDPRRDESAEVIRELGARMPIAEVQAALGDNWVAVRKNAAQSLRIVAPDVLRALFPEAQRILVGEEPGPTLQTHIWTKVFYFMWMNKAPLPPLIFDLLREMLDWHYWDVRADTARALGQIQRNIPDDLLQRLYWLRLHDPVPYVRQCADGALAAILAAEDGIEDD